MYTITLFDNQIEFILETIKGYLSKENEKYNYRKYSKSKKENFEKTFARDTYHQILSEYSEYIELNKNHIDKNKQAKIS